MRDILCFLLGVTLSCPLMAQKPSPDGAGQTVTPSKNASSELEMGASVEPEADTKTSLDESKRGLRLLLSTTLSFPPVTQQNPVLDGAGETVAPSEKSATAGTMELEIGGLENPEADAITNPVDQPTRGKARGANVDGQLVPGARFTVKQELAVRLKSPHEISNNRTALRMEYEKHFLDTYYLHFDVTETAYWGKDHRANARGANVFSDSSIKDAYLQFSKANTSIKLGRQILIWGESEAGAITDVISPRNLSELFFVSLEASRISQLMLTVDQFSSIGDWSFFYVPRARFNQYPQPGTAYHIDYYDGGAETQTVAKGGREFGLRWKKTFGNTDISLMGARLTDNDYTVYQDGFTNDGKRLIKNDQQRLSMIGATFTHSREGYLFTGEIARKSSKAYSNTNSQLVLKNAVDTSLKVEHNLGNAGNHAVSLEVVNNHVLGWNSEILPTARNTNSLVFGWRNAFLNENLTANFFSIYNQTYPSFAHSLFLEYKVNSSVSLTLDAFYLNVRDPNNEQYMYRGLNKAVFRALYQF